MKEATMAVIDEPKPAQDFATPGEMLKKAREKSGVSLDAIGKELNLSVTKLEALERDEYEKIASNVFALGYLRRFAKMVGVEEQSIVQSFNKYMAQMQATMDGITQAEESPAPKSALPPKLFMPAIVFGVALLILVTVIFSIQSGDDEKVSEASTAPRASMPADERDVSQTIPFPTDGLSESETISSAAETEFSQQEELQTEDLSPSSTAPTAVAVTDEASSSGAQIKEINAGIVTSRLAFTFIDDCWLKVTDGNGAVLHAQLEKAGSSLTLSAQAPVEVMVGNARAVSLSFNGEFVAIDSAPGHDTAKIVLGKN